MEGEGVKDFEITKAENGWIVLEGGSLSDVRYFVRRRWVAKSADDLGELVKALAGEEEVAKAGSSEDKK